MREDTLPTLQELFSLVRKPGEVSGHAQCIKHEDKNKTRMLLGPQRRGSQPKLGNEK